MILNKFITNNYDLSAPTCVLKCHMCHVTKRHLSPARHAFPDSRHSIDSTRSFYFYEPITSLKSDHVHYVVTTHQCARFILASSAADQSECVFVRLKVAIFYATWVLLLTAVFLYASNVFNKIPYI